MWEDGNVCNLDGDDERAGRSTRALLGPADEHVVRVRHRHAQDERSEDVEEDDAPHSLADGLADRLARVRGLAEGDAYDLGAGVGETRLHYGGPEAEEAACRAFNEVFSKCSWIVPVLEANDLTGRLASHGYYEACQYEHDDDEKLDGGHPEFCLPKERHVEYLKLISLTKQKPSAHLWTILSHIYGNDRHGKSCYKNSNIKVRTPILYDDTRGREVVWKNDGVFEEIIPACGISIPRQPHLQASG